MPKIMLGKKCVNMCKVCANFDPLKFCREESEEKIKPFTSLNRIECCTDYKFSQEKYDKLQDDVWKVVKEAVRRLLPRLLRVLGITVNLSTVYKEQAVKLGKSQDELTTVEKRQGFLDAIACQI